MENEWTKRIKELEDEVAKLIADRDADRKREYGYSQQTVDALTLERDKLRAERNDWKARYQSVAEMHDALIAEFNEMRAENKRLRVAIEAGVDLADFVAGERDMDKCEDCQVSECCSCCIIVAGRFLKKVPHDVAMEIAAQAQGAFGGNP